MDQKIPLLSDNLNKEIKDKRMQQTVSFPVNTVDDGHVTFIGKQKNNGVILRQLILMQKMRGAIKVTGMRCSH